MALTFGEILFRYFLECPLIGICLVSFFHDKTIRFLAFSCIGKYIGKWRNWVGNQRGMVLTRWGTWAECVLQIQGTTLFLKHSGQSYSWCLCLQFSGSCTHSLSFSFQGFKVTASSLLLFLNYFITLIISQSLTHIFENSPFVKNFFNHPNESVPFIPLESSLVYYESNLTSPDIEAELTF